MNILYIINILILIFILYILYIIKSNKNKSSLIKFNIDFTKDLEALLYIIDYKIRYKVDLVIKPRQEYDKSLITDKIFQDILDDITISVLNTLSDSYKLTLYKYFTEESLKEYVIEKVFYDLTMIVTTINNHKLLNFNSIFDDEDDDKPSQT